MGSLDWGNLYYPGLSLFHIYIYIYIYIQEHKLNHFRILCPEGSRVCLEILFNIKIIWLYPMATCYGLDGPRIKSQMERSFLHPSRPVLGPIQPLVRWVQGMFRGVKAAGTWRWPPITPFSAEVKERMEVYRYFPSGPSWPVLKWKLPLPLTLSQTLNFETCQYARKQVCGP